MFELSHALVVLPSCNLVDCLTLTIYLVDSVLVSVLFELSNSLVLLYSLVDCLILTLYLADSVYC
jgi:hypothetical protein